MKNFGILVFLLLCTVIAGAQNKFNATFIASPQLSWLSSDSKEVSNETSKMGFGYGVECDIFLGSDSYSITTGMTIGTSGGSLVYNPGEDFEFSGKTLASGTEVNYFLKNIEIPLAMKMRTRDFNRSRFFAQFGFTNWLNIKAKATTSDNTFSKESISDEISFYNLGLNLGAGIEYDLGGKNSLTGGIVFSNGFIDTTTNSSVKDDTALRVIRLRLGFVF
jgi:hypothetical protein